MMTNSRYYYGACVVLLSGCFAPKHKVPCHIMPEQYIHQRAISTDTPGADWWIQSRDPLLVSLIKTALTYNYDLQIAFETVETARARYQLSSSQLWPLLSFIGQTSRLQYSKDLAQNNFLTKFKFSFLQLGFDVFWELDFWGKLFNRRRYHKALFHADIEQMYGVYITLIADVARVYTDWCALNQQKIYAEKKYCVQKQRTILIADRVVSGLSSLIDLEQQEQQEDIIAQQKEKLAKLKEQAYHALLVLLGMQQNDPLDIQPGAIPFDDYTVTVGIPSQLLQRRPDIRAAERTIAAHNACIGAIRAEWFPQFNLLGSLTTEANTGIQWFSGKSIAWDVGPIANWPLINFGRINARIQEAKAEKRKAALVYSKAVITALKDVEDVLVFHFTALEQKKLAEHKYHAAYKEFMLQKSLVESGLTELLTMLTAEYNLYTQMNDYILKKQAVAYSVISLYKALGGGW